ncbi:MAG TPA: M23 family metallopeptidase [Candidatus Paceibacterota bacterium]
MVGTLVPAVARASVLSVLLASIRGNIAYAEMGNTKAAAGNVQTMPLLEAAMNIDPAPDKGGGDIVIVDGSALMPEEGPSGTIADISKPKNSTISVYVVREGDSLSSIATLFDVSPNTILWANDLPRGAILRAGQTLTILPVTGVKYTVKKGDTLSSIAKRFSGDGSEIASFNGIDESALSVGTELIIPDGEIAAPAPKPKTSGTAAKASVSVRSGATIGSFMSPLSSYKRTQGIHGYNGVDLAASSGTSIMASAAGEVIVARGSGYNGGYGSYVVIQHADGSQTLYAHQSKVIVSVGQAVVQGQVIGYVGSTGKSTGAHLHFEIRNGPRNPF